MLRRRVPEELTPLLPDRLEGAVRADGVVRVEGLEERLPAVLTPRL